MQTFMEKLQARWDEGKFVCVGLDSDYAKLPESVKTPVISGSIIAFNQAIVDATKDLVCAYKPNAAFYEKHGVLGQQALEATIKHIRRVAPGVAVILDYKRGDIGNTNDGYVTGAFGVVDADAVTVHPYMGQESLLPFLDCKNKGVIVLCRTSNPGAGEFQDAPVLLTRTIAQKWGYYRKGRGVKWVTPLYKYVAHRVTEEWNINNNCCLVVGATVPQELTEVRKIAGDMPILIPGIGAQGGEVEATVKAGANSCGQGMIINSSRGIIFASKGEDFAEAARAATQELHDQITQYLPKEA